jgi:hypothetical protein
MDVQMAGVLWLGGAFLLGLLNCYFGYRLFLVTVGIVGFFMGASIGYLLGVWTAQVIIGVAAAILLGLLAAWAAIMAYYAFIFVVGAFAFALVSAFLAGLFFADVSPFIPLVAGLVGGFASFWLQRVIITIATALQGALAAVLAIAALVSGGGVEGYREMFHRLLGGDLTQMGGVWFYAGLIAWLILVATGLAAQFKHGKEMYRRRA